MALNKQIHMALSGKAVAGFTRLKRARFLITALVLFLLFVLESALNEEGLDFVKTVDRTHEPRRFGFEFGFDTLGLHNTYCAGSKTQENFSRGGRQNPGDI